MQNYMGGVLGGFQAGQQMRQQMDTRKAMGALLNNPNDPQAMQMLGRADPQAAMQFQSQQGQQRAQQLQQAREQLTTTFQLLSSATDEASYQRARQTAAQLGMDLSSIPPNFNQQWVQQSAQQAQALLGKVDQELTTFQKDYQFLQGKDPTLADQFLRNKAEGGPLIANNGDGTFTVIPRSAAPQQSRQPPPAAVQRLRANPHEASQFDEVFGPGAAQRILGGQTGSAPSGPFQP